MPWETIAERIEGGVAAHGWSQARLAREAKLPNRQMISRIKTGELVGRKYLEDLARALGCTVEWLTTGRGDPPRWSLTSEQAIAARVAAPALNYSAEMQRALEMQIEALRAQLAAAVTRNEQLERDLAEARSALASARETIAHAEAVVEEHTTRRQARRRPRKRAQ